MVSFAKMKDFTTNIDNALDALFKVEKDGCNKKKLLEDDKPVYLQIAVFKIPYVYGKRKKFLQLPHPLHGKEPEICLFVSNRKTEKKYKITTDEFIDYCVNYYTDLLEKHKVKGITSVMPLKQLKAEYGTYECKRKLANRFDIFICKNTLLHNYRFLTSLGKVFKDTHKEPYGVAFPKKNVDFDPDFQQRINKIIHTAVLKVNPFSDNYTIPFGKLSNTKEELKENLNMIIKQLFSKKIFPGGIANVKAMYLWPSQSKTIPLYISTEVPNNLPTPRLKCKKRKQEIVIDEISTLPGKKVQVLRNGRVIVMKDENVSEPEDETEDDESFDDRSEEELEVEEREEKNGNSLGRKEEKSESESENDEEIEKMEERMLRMRREAEEETYPNPEILKKDEKNTKNNFIKTKKTGAPVESFKKKKVKSAAKDKIGKVKKSKNINKATKITKLKLKETKHKKIFLN